MNLRYYSSWDVVCTLLFQPLTEYCTMGHIPCTAGQKIGLFLSYSYHSAEGRDGSCQRHDRAIPVAIPELIDTGELCSF